MRRITTILIAASVPFAIAACGDDVDTVNPPANAAVSALDNCDSASFNAGIGAGTCKGAGTMTLAQFNTELNATGRVAAWHFDPSSLALRSGQAIVFTNRGGEEHTFTEVEQFGGGIIPALNTASGYTTEAQECKDLKPTDHIASGSSFTTENETEIGVHRYQCCIHPWMQEVITVSGS
jgi:plastocyanin